MFPILQKLLVNLFYPWLVLSPTKNEWIGDNTNHRRNISEIYLYKIFWCYQQRKKVKANSYRYETYLHIFLKVKPIV